MLNKHSVVSVVFVALLGFSVTVAAEFSIGVEGGLNHAIVDHSYNFAGSDPSSDGVSCGTIKEIDDGIGNPIGLYGQYVISPDGEGLGVRYGYTNAGNSTIHDFSGIWVSKFEDIEAAFFFGTGFSLLSIDVEEFSLVGLCNTARTDISLVFPAQEIEFYGSKTWVGFEKTIYKSLAWHLAGTAGFYTSARINTRDGFETAIEPYIFSLTTGLSIRF